MDFVTVIAGVVVFLLMILLLVGILLFAKSKLVQSGPVVININGEKDMEVSAGDTLLSTLSNNKLFLHSACGGQGTCSECKCVVVEGGCSILPTDNLYYNYL